MTGNADDLVEAVAQAICRAADLDDWDKLRENEKYLSEMHPTLELYREEARAAIKLVTAYFAVDPTRQRRLMLG